jgi:hypothetical protein
MTPLERQADRAQRLRGKEDVFFDALTDKDYEDFSLFELSDWMELAPCFGYGDDWAEKRFHGWGESNHSKGYTRN